MLSDEDMKKFYKDGTASSADKLVKKFNDKAALAVEKLKSDVVIDGWHQKVSSEESKKRFKAKVSKLSASDLTAPMESRGKAGYTRATGDANVQQKWLTNAKPYISAAQEFSKTKKVVITEQDAIDNMVSNMQNMKKKYQEING